MTIDASTAGIIASLVAVMLILARVIEHLIMRKIRNGKTPDGSSGLSKEQAAQLKSLFDTHNRFDTNGVPLWYVPHDLRSMPGQILNQFRDHVADDGIQFQTINRELVALGREQNLMNNRINDLISSTNRLVDRIGDLITRLEKNSN